MSTIVELLQPTILAILARQEFADWRTSPKIWEIHVQTAAPEETKGYMQSCFAFATPAIAHELHRQNHYRVRFNADPKYPQIIEICERLSVP